MAPQRKGMGALIARVEWNWLHEIDYLYIYIYIYYIIFTFVCLSECQSNLNHCHEIVPQPVRHVVQRHSLISLSPLFLALSSSRQEEEVVTGPP